MAAPDTINVSQLAWLVGTQEAPVLIDMRVDADHPADPLMLGIMRALSLAGVALQLALGVVS